MRSLTPDGASDMNKLPPHPSLDQESMLSALVEGQVLVYSSKYFSGGSIEFSCDSDSENVVVNTGVGPRYLIPSSELDNFIHAMLEAEYEFNQTTRSGDDFIAWFGSSIGSFGGELIPVQVAPEEDEIDLDGPINDAWRVPSQ